MTTYASQTTVSPDRSRAEIERTLSRYGATGFMYGWSDRGAISGKMPPLLPGGDDVVDGEVSGE